MEKVNLLGQTIMEQRSEIEEFFIMALESCKKEIDEQYSSNSGRK
jgi:hypothetical protein